MPTLLLSLPGLLALQAAAVRVLFVTDAGEIEIEVEPAQAPITSASFLQYVDAGLFDEGEFYRTVRPDYQHAKPVRIDVIQARANCPARRVPPPIPLERTSVTGLSRKDGTQRWHGPAPTEAAASSSSASAIPSLDFGGARNPAGQEFAAFGRVVGGMDVVRRIQMSPANGETLTPAIRILSGRRK